MRRIRTLMGAVAVGTLLFVAGCADAPTTPAGPSVRDLTNGGEPSAVYFQGELEPTLTA